MRGEARARMLPSLGLAALAAAALLLAPPAAGAAGVEASGVVLGRTAVIEFANGSDGPLGMIRVWFDDPGELDRFKAEDGWTGTKTAQGTLVLTSARPVEPGASVKVGIVTSSEVPAINWKVLDGRESEVDTGRLLPEQLASLAAPEEPPDPPAPDRPDPSDPPAEEPPGPSGSVTGDSVFRIVPDKPVPGSPIRVAGERFGPSQGFDFFIDSEKLGSIRSDADGRFMATMEIPGDQEPDRVEFRIRGPDGMESKISVRIDEPAEAAPPPDEEEVVLSITGIPDVVHRGDFLEVGGTGRPGSVITGEIMNPEGEIVNSRTVSVGSDGRWELDPIIVPIDTPLGGYSATITDGRETVVTEWAVESGKVIAIVPNTIRYSAGDTIVFNGTAAPGEPIELILEDPFGNELYANTLATGENGTVGFEYEIPRESMDGTYTLIAAQGDESELIFFGIGQLPSIPIRFEFDRINYRSGDVAEIDITGKPSEVYNLLVINPSDQQVGDTVTVGLRPDGRGSYMLDLDGYPTGVYTAVIGRGSVQSSGIFTVGLQQGSGEITISTTKTEYHRGDPILVLGSTANANSLLAMSLIDPGGHVVRKTSTFSNSNARISEDTFRIPSDAAAGTWQVSAQSGANLAKIDILVLEAAIEGIVIHVTEGEIPALGRVLNIEIQGGEQTVQIEIIDDIGQTIATLEFPATSDGRYVTPWIIPRDIVPGTYTIRATDLSDSAETTYVIE